MPCGHGVQLVPHASTLSSATQVPLHLWKPVVHTTSQVPLVHTAVPPTCAGQTAHDAPHEAAEFARHCEPQVLKPKPQVKPQLPEAQVAVELAGGTQGLQALPQLLTEVLLTQALPHRCTPTPQLTPQEVPSQVAVPLGVKGHAVQLEPQLATLVSARHWLPQAWKPALQVKPQLVPLQVAVPLSGAEQGEHCPPQLLMLLLGAQAPLQAWRPVLQARPQTSLLEHKEEPPVIIGQGAQVTPQEFSELGTHC